MGEKKVTFYTQLDEVQANLNKLVKNEEMRVSEFKGLEIKLKDISFKWIKENDPIRDYKMKLVKSKRNLIRSEIPIIILNKNLRDLANTKCFILNKRVEDNHYNTELFKDKCERYFSTQIGLTFDTPQKNEIREIYKKAISLGYQSGENVRMWVDNHHIPFVNKSFK